MDMDFVEGIQVVDRKDFVADIQVVDRKDFEFDLGEAVEGFVRKDFEDSGYSRLKPNLVDPMVDFDY